MISGLDCRNPSWGSGSPFYCFSLYSMPPGPHAAPPRPPMCQLCSVQRLQLPDLHLGLYCKASCHFFPAAARRLLLAFASIFAGAMQICCIVSGTCVYDLFGTLAPNLAVRCYDAHCTRRESRHQQAMPACLCQIMACLPCAPACCSKAAQGSMCLPRISIQSQATHWCSTLLIREQPSGLWSSLLWMRTNIKCFKWIKTAGRGHKPLAGTVPGSAAHNAAPEARLAGVTGSLQSQRWV